MRVDVPFRVKVWKLVVVTPQVVVSALVGLIVVAFTPLAFGAIIVACVTATVGVLFTGRGEAQALRVLTCARVPSPAETTVLAPVLGELASRDLPVSHVLVRHQDQGLVAVARGRGTLIVAPWLARELNEGRLSRAEVVAALAHAIASPASIRYVHDLPLSIITIPWDLLAFCVRFAVRMFAWIPLATFAWKVRFLIGIAAIINTTQVGTPVWGIAAASLIGFTYAVPAADAALTRYQVAYADDYLIQIGLGPTLARLLRRTGRTAGWERLHHLETTVRIPPELPRLTQRVEVEPA